VNTGINWTETLKDWTPSEGDCELIPPESATIDEFIRLTQVCFEEGRDEMVKYFNERSLRSARQDKTDKWQLLEIVGVQLREHRKLWKTHLKKDSQTQNLTLELPVAIKQLPHLRYFKVFIKDGKQKLSNPKSINSVTLDYHEAKESVEVIYV